MVFKYRVLEWFSYGSNADLFQNWI